MTKKTRATNSTPSSSFLDRVRRLGHRVPAVTALLGCSGTRNRLRTSTNRTSIPSLPVPLPTLSDEMRRLAALADRMARAAVAMETTQERRHPFQEHSHRVVKEIEATTTYRAFYDGVSPTASSPVSGNNTPHPTSVERRCSTRWTPTNVSTSTRRRPASMIQCADCSSDLASPTASSPLQLALLSGSHHFEDTNGLACSSVYEECGGARRLPLADVAPSPNRCSVTTDVVSDNVPSSNRRSSSTSSLNATNRLTTPPSPNHCCESTSPSDHEVGSAAISGVRLSFRRSRSASSSAAACEQNQVCEPYRRQMAESAFASLPRNRPNKDQKSFSITSSSSPISGRSRVRSRLTSANPNQQSRENLIESCGARRTTRAESRTSTWPRRKHVQSNEIVGNDVSLRNDSYRDVSNENSNSGKSRVVPDVISSSFPSKRDMSCNAPAIIIDDVTTLGDIIAPSSAVTEQSLHDPADWKHDCSNRNMVTSQPRRSQAASDVTFSESKGQLNVPSTSGESPNAESMSRVDADRINIYRYAAHNSENPKGYATPNRVAATSLAGGGVPALLVITLPVVAKVSQQANPNRRALCRQMAVPPAGRKLNSSRLIPDAPSIKNDLIISLVSGLDKTDSSRRDCNDGISLNRDGGRVVIDGTTQLRCRAPQPIGLPVKMRRRSLSGPVNYGRSWYD